MIYIDKVEIFEYIFEVKNKRCKFVLYNFYFSIGIFYINLKLYIRNKILIKIIYSIIFFVSFFLRKIIDYIIGIYKCI